MSVGEGKGLMKLTWFGNTAFRLHIGGQVIVLDAAAAPNGVDAAEVLSGADRVIERNVNEPLLDARTWRPRPRERLLDAGDLPRPVDIWSLGPDCILLDADEDAPLLLIAGPLPTLGRWAEKAIVILAGQQLMRRGEQLVDAVIPRLIALAGSDAEVEAAFIQLPAKLDGAGLLALSPGLAVEV